MDIIELNLTEEELKKVKNDFNNGQVYTDGCFCGHAVSNFRGDLYLIMNFSCRKSMSCDNSYYQVTSLGIYERASNLYSEERLDLILDGIWDEESEYNKGTIDGREFILANSYYDDATREDIYLLCESLKFDKKSSKGVQKKLFKYYKKKYGEWSDAKFKDVGLFEWSGL